MAQILTFEEIKQQYHDEWLLIAYTDLDPETLQVLQGEVLAHSPDIEVVYQALPSAKGRNAAIEFVGVPQANIAHSYETLYPSCKTSPPKNGKPCSAWATETEPLQAKF